MYSRTWRVAMTGLAAAAGDAPPDWPRVTTDRPYRTPGVRPEMTQPLPVEVHDAEVGALALDIGVAVARQRRPRVRKTLEPVRDGAVAEHGNDPALRLSSGGAAASKVRVDRLFSGKRDLDALSMR